MPSKWGRENMASSIRLRTKMDATRISTGKLPKRFLPRRRSCLRRRRTLPSLKFSLRNLLVRDLRSAGATLTASDCLSSLSAAPSGLVALWLLVPRLAPLRQAQGKLWAAFFRRVAACTEKTLAKDLLGKRALREGFR